MPSSTRRSSASDLQAILLVRELGFSEVPARCKELSVERFNHAPAILEQFQVYARSYRPNKLGTLPVSSRTLPPSMTPHAPPRRLRHVAGGQSAERHLLDRGIVCIVDTTNFHPELGAW
jgi:hypothetical protein